MRVLISGPEGKSRQNKGVDRFPNVLPALQSPEMMFQSKNPGNEAGKPLGMMEDRIPRVSIGKKSTGK